MAAGPAAASERPPARPDTRQVMFVGNNLDGTADIIDAATFEQLTTINVIPDKEERLDEIGADPWRLAFFLFFRQAAGEGEDQLVDDLFTSHDGRMVVVSRPSFADVVAISLATREIVWRFPMEGLRSDHMDVSPDGSRVLVSDTTANKVHELDLLTGRKLGEFPSGDSPHENAYSQDGSRIFHASIGRVFTPTDAPELGPTRDTSKGDRRFQIVDARTMKILKRWDIGEKLAEIGRDDMDSAVRPMAIAPGERIAYLQISFHHGFVEFDLERERVLRIADLPISEKARNLPREEYPVDEAHHGLAINPEGTKLCAAATVSDYAAIVSRASFAYKTFNVGEHPRWSTNGHSGKHCWVSVYGDDRVVVLDYASERQLASIPVGDGPARVRPGAVQRGLLAKLPQPRGCLSRRASVGPRSIGRVRLGLTRRQLLRRLPEPQRRTGRSWRWCVKRDRGRVAASFDRRGRVALVTSTAPGHGDRGVRPGSRSARVRRAYPRRRSAGRGVLRASPRSRRLVGLRRGQVRYVGVASHATLRSAATLRRYLRRAGL